MSSKGNHQLRPSLQELSINAVRDIIYTSTTLDANTCDIIYGFIRGYIVTGKQVRGALPTLVFHEKSREGRKRTYTVSAIPGWPISFTLKLRNISFFNLDTFPDCCCRIEDWTSIRKVRRLEVWCVRSLQRMYPGIALVESRNRQLPVIDIPVICSLNMRLYDLLASLTEVIVIGPYVAFRYCLI